jgi:hypothetical protein
MLHPQRLDNIGRILVDLKCTVQTALRVALVTFVFIGIEGAAVAQQPSQAPIGAIRSACRSDYQAHGASVPTGGSAALECLQKNVASLSAPCQKAVTAAEGGTPESSSGSTQPSAESPKVTPAASTPSWKDSSTGSATQGAANPPASKVPTESAAPKRPSKQQAAAIQTACHSDFPKHCPGVHPGTRTAWSCLQANAASLSSPC